MNGAWVLVVEDDEDIRDTIILLLSTEGYEVVGAADGLDALEQIRSRGRPSVILLDMRMPRMNGAEFAAALHGDPALAPAPIVIVSGDTNAREMASSVGAHALLTKPIELPELRATVRRLVPES